MNMKTAICATRRRPSVPAALTRVLAGFITMGFAIMFGAVWAPAWGQGGMTSTFPNKPIRIIVPYPPGGIGDTVPRIIGEALAQRIGQAVIIENKPGAEGTIGGQVVAKSAPDGYTLFLGAGGTMAAMPALRKNPPYDPVAHFTPISHLGKIAFFLVVHPSLPATTLP